MCPPLSLTIRLPTDPVDSQDDEVSKHPDVNNIFITQAFSELTVLELRMGPGTCVGQRQRAT